ncbi:MAG: putative PurR-regulated permease PerM [Parvicellaceae bacterium]|jgi:predicted PurR-regulated permease PerM
MELSNLKKYKSHLIFSGLILTFVIAFYYAGEIILPFILGLIGAAIFNPAIKKIQKLIPNRSVSVTVLLTMIVGLFVGAIMLFSSLIVNDFKRFNEAFVIFADNNSEGIDEVTNEVKNYISKIYSEVDLEKAIGETNIDSLALDAETIAASVSKLTSFFSSDAETVEVDRSYNWFLIVIYSIGYFIMIIYSYPYFESRYQRYFGQSEKTNKYLTSIIQDFNVTFTTYFRQRTKVVLICSFVFIVAFLIIGIPGAIILGVVAGILCYVSHFHFLALIPLSLSCWALSIEQGQSFLLYFGIVFGLFIIIAVLEELVFFPKIMKGVANMNSAIMFVSIAFWTYVFGGVGLVIALPLTTVILIYIDRLLRNREPLNKEEMQ